MSYPLEVPVESHATSSAPPSQKLKATLSNKNSSGLTYKQQLKQDAALWAEFLYSEYKREKTLREGEQTMPTHYDNPDA
jgi:hypothetical protein